MRIPYISMLAAGALALSGCAYGSLGYGGGYGPYGSYGGPTFSVGYSSGYYGGYGGYGYGYPSYGWYDNFYYPGTGYYVYDTYRRPHAMSSTQRAYWSRRSPALRSSETTRVRANWSGFNRPVTTSAQRHSTREERRASRDQRREDRRDRRPH